ncbi:hypothetical protein V6N13_089438 [Hibiscus sabdariffa]|uniref:Uncharacterized protein n=1 Tax=Hibiscus sabdariffa TaxID=183260 RepID=A0ABR2NSV2_9ROSI
MKECGFRRRGMINIKPERGEVNGNRFQRLVVEAQHLYKLSQPTRNGSEHANFPELDEAEMEKWMWQRGRCRLCTRVMKQGCGGATAIWRPILKATPVFLPVSPRLPVDHFLSL